MKDNIKIISKLLRNGHITVDEFVLLYDAMNKVAEYIPPYLHPINTPFYPNYPYLITCDSN